MVAVEHYLKRDHGADLREWNRRCDVIAAAAKQGEERHQRSDRASHRQPRAAPGAALGCIGGRSTPPEAMKLLAEGEPAIEACPLTDGERLVFGVCTMESAMRRSSQSGFGKIAA
ncbi:MAG: hypothetical protein U5J83_15790 [Bryobacterales bacterium]|nr:hypothetical protein [Bryobacterales bacterium]